MHFSPHNNDGISTIADSGTYQKPAILKIPQSTLSPLTNCDTVSQGGGEFLWGATVSSLLLNSAEALLSRTGANIVRITTTMIVALNREGFTSPRDNR